MPTVSEVPMTSSLNLATICPLDSWKGKKLSRESILKHYLYNLWDIWDVFHWKSAKLWKMRLVLEIMTVLLNVDINFFKLRNFLFIGPQVYPRGSLVIAHVRWSVGPSVPWSVVRPSYIRDCSLVFSNFGRRVYRKGSLVIALVPVSVRVCVCVRL